MELRLRSPYVGQHRRADRCHDIACLRNPHDCRRNARKKRRAGNKAHGANTMREENAQPPSPA
eukprot:10706516-Lingulodinium_polyedra.AAC.1